MTRVAERILRSLRAAILAAALAVSAVACTSGPTVLDGPGMQRSQPPSATHGIEPLVELWCEVALPEPWTTSARSVAYDFFNADETLHARLVQTEMPDVDKDWTDRKELEVITPTGVLKPIEFGSDWTIGRAIFTDNYLVVRTQVRINMAPRWKIWVWDPKTPDVPARLIRETDSGGEAMQFNPASVRGDKLTWVERGEVEGSWAILIYDIANHKMTRVKDKVGQGAPQWFGDIVVWQDHVGGDASPAGMMADGSAWTPPPQLSGLAQAPQWAIDGDVWAWVNPARSTAYTWRTGWPQAEAIKVIGGVDTPMREVVVAGDFVFLTTDRGTLVADTTTRSVATLRDGPADVTVYPTGQVVLEYVNPELPKGAPTIQHMWTTRELAHLPGC